MTSVSFELCVRATFQQRAGGAPQQASGSVRAPGGCTRRGCVVGGLRQGPSESVLTSEQTIHNTRVVSRFFYLCYLACDRYLVSIFLLFEGFFHRPFWLVFSLFLSTINSSLLSLNLCVFIFNNLTFYLFIRERNFGINVT